MSYKITVVIPTYNRLAVLKKTLMYIGNQSIGREQYQIIVVDDGSTDGTGEYLKTLNGIDYFINETNKGRAVTRNTGIYLAKSDFLLFLDDDIWADEDLIKNHIEKHKDNKVVVGAIYPAKEIKTNAINKYYNKHHLWCVKEMEKNRDNLPYNFLKTANLSIDRDVLKNVGSFDERFYKYGCEDTELGMRLKKHGYNIIYNKNAIGYHYHDETVISFIKKTIDSIESSEMLASLKYNCDNEYNGFFTPKFHKIGRASCRERV